MKIFRFPEIRKKLIFTLGAVIVFRLLAHIPVPGVDATAIKAYLSSNTLFGIFDLFSGGGFQNFSIVTLGVGPYINASIVIQLFTMMIPAWEELSKEGEAGREKLNMYTKFLTVPMAIIQAYGIYFLLSKQGIMGELVFFDLALLIITLMSGSLLLVWLGDLVTERGIGNGVSVLIFVSIISRLPTGFLGFIANINYSNLLQSVIFILLALLVVVAVVLVNEGTRNVLIEYGRRGNRSQKVTNFLPLKINQAGVIPIIFAVSIVTLPSLIAAPLQSASNFTLSKIGFFLGNNFSSNTIGYNVFYFLLVLGFTYFYTSIQFDPEKISDDIKKRGGFIPGIRPGKATEKYLRNIVNKITLAGAMFLGLIAVLPFIIQQFINVGNLTVGGTSLLIGVSVVLEVVRQVESMMVTNSYDTYLR